MPYKSDKQRRYMNWAASQGIIKQSVVDKFNRESKGATKEMKDDEKQMKKVASKNQYTRLKEMLNRSK